MTRAALHTFLFAGVLVSALSCAGPTAHPLEADDAGSTGGYTGSNIGGATATGGATGTGGVFGSDTGGAPGGGNTGGVFGGDTGGSSGTADAGTERPDGGRDRGDGGRRMRDGGFGGGFDGGRRRDGGGGGGTGGSGGGGMGGMCPMGTRNGQPCMTMGAMCSSMFNGTTRTCTCQDANGTLAWTCMRM